MAETRVASCSCGTVKLEMAGDPLVASTCYCPSCPPARPAFAPLPRAPARATAAGGTPPRPVPQDRLAGVSGTARRQPPRLKADSPTRRFVAQCCNAPVALEFTKGHWLSVYAGRIAEAERPRPAMRTMIQDRPDGVKFTDDVPSYATHSGKFMWKLLSAWAAMGFRAPPVEKTQGWAR
ncbi:MAG: hypothetical protein IBJ13_01615 [Sphingopyxis sp.]|nr:hypothetical protein [Sphingopyxis sp.]